ncbi:hypothetical protein ACU686_31615 [Yinghuangia aomiensis]
MRSSNPVLSRRGAFRAPQAGQQAPQYGAPYAQPSGTGNPFGGQRRAARAARVGRPAEPDVPPAVRGPAADGPHDDGRRGRQDHDLPAGASGWARPSAGRSSRSRNFAWAGAAAAPGVRRVPRADLQARGLPGSRCSPTRHSRVCSSVR